MPLSFADMWGRRIVYLLSLVGSMVFFIVYREWFSFLLLVLLAALPWFSLLISLPAMVISRCSLRCPESVRMAVPARTALEVTGKLPAPPVKARLRLQNRLSGMDAVGRPGERIPTDHCGYVQISYQKALICDYLGLFSRRLRSGSGAGIYVEPKPVPCKLPQQPELKTVKAWRPKPGGGFSENHDLRLYRPGDDLRGIHWKMTAKTGKLIYREPIEPVQQGCLLTLGLWGDPDTLDKKLGQLLYASQALLQKQMPHTVRCSTGEGVLEFKVTDVHSQKACLQGILSSAPAAGEQKLQDANALWQYHIGGDGNG